MSREDFVKYVLLMKVEENERHAVSLRGVLRTLPSSTAPSALLAPSK